MEAAYFGVNMWAQAVETAGSESAPAVRQAMRVQSFHAPEGHVHIDPENQYTWKTMRIGRIGDRGQFDVLWSSERPMRPEPFASSRCRARGATFSTTSIAAGMGVGVGASRCDVGARTDLRAPISSAACGAVDGSREVIQYARP